MHAWQGWLVPHCILLGQDHRRGWVKLTVLFLNRHSIQAPNLLTASTFFLVSSLNTLRDFRRVGVAGLTSKTLSESFGGPFDFFAERDCTLKEGLAALCLGWGLTLWEVEGALIEL